MADMLGPGASEREELRHTGPVAWLSLPRLAAGPGTVSRLRAPLGRIDGAIRGKPVRRSWRSRYVEDGLPLAASSEPILR